MKRLLPGILITCATVTTPVMAQTVTYACQYLKTAGLNWEDGQWKDTVFENDAPFFLKTENGLLTPDILIEYMGFGNAPSVRPICTATFGEQIDYPSVQSCTSASGMTVSFSAETASGGLAWLFGASAPDSYRTKSELLVAPFVCTKV